MIDFLCHVFMTIDSKVIDDSSSLLYTLTSVVGKLGYTLKSNWLLVTNYIFNSVIRLLYKLLTPKSI